MPVVSRQRVNDDSCVELPLSHSAPPALRALPLPRRSLMSWGFKADTLKKIKLVRLVDNNLNLDSKPN
ncbi:hypothetical protein QF001_008066 [Paraburkholderia youngii]